jgi:hypothetical protein
VGAVSDSSVLPAQGQDFLLAEELAGQVQRDLATAG